MALYKKEDLGNMTTYQLKEIAFKEKLAIANIRKLTKRELIDTIMEYRGLDDNLFIEKYNSLGFESLSKFFKKTVKKELHDQKISYPEEIKLYKGLKVDYFYQYELSSKGVIEEVNIPLVDENFNLCSIFNLVNINERFYLYKGKDMEVKSYGNHKLSLIYLPKKYSEEIYNIYTGKSKKQASTIEYYRLPILNLAIESLKESKEPLIIDIGSTNTTLGTYKINDNSLEHEDSYMKIIKVLNRRNKCYHETPLIPTAAAVKSIQEDRAGYLFGYDASALYREKDKYKDSNVFFNIKRWLNNIDKDEEITDKHGKKKSIKRREIFKSYLDYLIDIAQQQTKYRFNRVNVIFSIKERERYSKIIKELLPQYETDSLVEMDGSSASLLNNIWSLIDRKVYEDDKSYEALIIDCGSRKTELNSCEFKIRSNRISYEVDINSCYQNGDMNFGGDNITFRILQYLKILIARDLYNTKDQGERIPCFDKDIYRIIDEKGIPVVYKELEEEYERAEKIVPTKFNRYKTKKVDDYIKIKRNYYYLFEAAKRIKEDFFKEENIYEKTITFKETNGKGIIELDRWKLHYYHNEELVSLKELDDIRINRYEIEALLKGDIYNIIKTFLEEIYEGGSILKYSLIKLTGQSFNINIFKDAIKEFVPGRIINFKRKYNEYDLRLDCLKGVLRYLYLRDLGLVNFNIESEVLKIPYTISGFNHKNEERELIHNLYNEKASNSISRYMGSEIALKLYMKDSRGNTVKEFIYNSSLDSYSDTTVKEIEERYSNIIFQFETDSISNDEIKFFVWLEKSAWSFGVVPIARRKDSLLIGPEKFYTFEDDSWELDFYNGLK